MTTDVAPSPNLIETLPQPGFSQIFLKSDDATYAAHVWDHVFVADFENLAIEYSQDGNNLNECTGDLSDFINTVRKSDSKMEATLVRRPDLLNLLFHSDMIQFIHGERDRVHQALHHSHHSHHDHAPANSLDGLPRPAFSDLFLDADAATYAAQVDETTFLADFEALAIEFSQKKDNLDKCAHSMAAFINVVRNSDPKMKSATDSRPALMDRLFEDEKVKFVYGERERVHHVLKHS